MATGSSSNSGIVDNQAYTHRCLNLIINVGGMVYRHILKNELEYRKITLPEFLVHNEVEIKRLNPHQDLLKVLFPGNAAARTDKIFDITAIAFLLQNFFIKEGKKLLVGNYSTRLFSKAHNFKWITLKEEKAWALSVKDKLYPWNTDVIADISRIKGYRNMIHDIVDTKKWLTETEFNKLWSEMSAALLNLGRAFGIPNMFFEVEKVYREPLDLQTHDVVKESLELVKDQQKCHTETLNTINKNVTDTRSTTAIELAKIQKNNADASREQAELLKDIAKKQHGNLKECSEREMNLRQDSFSDAVFVKTRVYENISQRLKDNRIVVICGNHGEGKSTIALKLISEHSKKGYRILSTPNEWRSVDIENCDALIIDDIFGAAVLDTKAVKRWHPYLEQIRQAVSKSDVFVIITIKPHILQQAKKRLSSKLWDMFDANVESVISEEMSNDEHHMILLNHLNANKREINTDTLNSCLTKYAQRPAKIFHIGFPQCASMYAKFPKLFEKGFMFFEKPIYFIKNCLGDILIDNTTFSAFFFLWSQPNQTVRITELEKEEEDEHSESFRRLKLCNVSSSSHVENGLRPHKDGFINYIEDNEEFRFSHDIIADVVGLLICEKNIKDGINLCSLDFLKEYVTIADTTQTNQIDKVCIKKSRFELLWNRLLYFYRSNKEITLLHDALKNETFVSEFQKREKKSFDIFHGACSNGIKDVVKCMLKCGFKCEGRVVRGFSPIHSSADFGHNEIVILLAKNDLKLLELKMPDGENVPQKYRGATVLHVAVLNGFFAMIKELLTLKPEINLNIRDFEGNTPLLLAIKEYEYTIAWYFLTRTDADIKTPDINKSTPLMEATRNGKKDFVKKLSNNMTVNCINSNDQTALDIAHLKKEDKIVRILRNKNAKTAAELTGPNDL